MSESKQLVEHFFRHEYANLCAVLTRAFGVARINLVEDMVSSAMMEAMNAWKQSGIPNNPAAWIHRVAKNRILDALRREKTHEKALAFAGLGQEEHSSSQSDLIDHWLGENQIDDGVLRMMFVCCHPSIDRISQIALSLKILCGFSLQEISRGLLTPLETVKKKVQRAKTKLASENIAVEIPPADQLQKRLKTVHEVLYLMFNEGYSATQGNDVVRDDVCEEAARLCHLLCQHEQLSTPESKALLALMLFHAARLESRTDSFGAPVLLSEQNRSTWDRKLIAMAERWLVRAVEEEPSRYHYEAVIAQMHCAARCVEETDWERIAVFYERLNQYWPSPLYRLNRAIALAQANEIEEALGIVEQLRRSDELRDYYLLECALGFIYGLSGDINTAIDAYLRALQLPIAEHQKGIIKRRIQELTQGQEP